MDKIMMNQLEFYGYHGVYPEETKLGQRFYVDLIMEMDLSKSAKSDNLNDTIDYGAVHDLVKSIMEGEPRNLVETLAEEISSSLLNEFSLIENVTVKVIKPDPPIPGHYESVAVEITRSRSV